mgnify:CR=1 FL=1
MAAKGGAPNAEDWNLVCRYCSLGEQTEWNRQALPTAIVAEIDDAVWSLQDGYGMPGYDPPQGWDWSGIRDSSPEAVKNMADAIRAILAIYERMVARAN